MKLLFTFVLSTLICLILGQAPQLTIETNTGTVTGLINGTTPNVRAFLKIPFAKPPTSNLRWEPPQPLDTNSSYIVDATQYPYSCPQYLSSIPTVYNQVIQPWIPYRYDQPAAAGASLQTSSEDCLYLAVWTPSNATNTSSLPVMFFITGGAFETNGVYVPAQIPNHWVQRTQSHVVVTINYRLNIFGFPNAAGLQSQNLGLLDQRAALEWVQDNIQQFGGDPNRITMWGQSAGAISTDYHNFAFPEDPIVTSFFAQSGSVFLDIGTHDTPQSNFSFVAANFGCNNTNTTQQLSCMRKVPATNITNFVGRYGDNGTLPSITFAPVADEQVVFANYTQRYEMGAYANLPTIYSSCDMEGEALVPYPSDPNVTGPNATLALGTTLEAFLCPAAMSSMLRSQHNATTPTYRYLFSGNFSNVSPLFWMGAYHASDLAFMFGTHQDLQSPGTGAGSTSEEFAVSEAMQNVVLDMARNSGYTNLWPTYQQGIIVNFGNGSTVQKSVNVSSVDGVCSM